MDFSVKLLRVPPIGRLSGWDVFKLMSNARHVGGDFWIFEGEVFALGVPNITVVREAVSEAYGNLSAEQLVTHCEETFSIDLGSAAPAWKMSADAGR